MLMNGTSSTQYTPLESLLFFQSLRAQDITSINFGKIADELIAVPLVKNDASFDRDRLSADALQNLYLTLVKEEARQETQGDTSTGQGDALQNGELSPRSRKRKAPSPTLPTVEAASKHVHLLPRLLYKLYARYRESVVSAIKVEEQEIKELDLEIKRIEDGEFDDKLRLQDTQQTNGVEQNVRPGPADVPTGAAAEYDAAEGGAGAIASPDQSKTDERPRSARASIDALVNHTPGPDAMKSPTHTRKPSGALPPLSEMAPEHLTGPRPIQPGRTHSGQANSPLLPAGPQPVYHASPPIKQASPYLPQYPHPGMGQAPATSPPSQHSHPSQSPTSPSRTLPMPPGMKMQTSPVTQNGFQQPPRNQMPMHPPQYGSPSQGRSPVPLHPAGRGYPQQPYQNYPQQYPPYPQIQQQQYIQQQQQQGHVQIRPSQQGGFQLPPFQVSAQEPTKIHHQYQNLQQTTPQTGRYSLPPGQVTSRGGQSPYGQYAPFPQTPQPVPRPVADDELTKSVVAGLRKRRSTSTWKSLGHPPLNPPRSPERPPVEPISPVRPAAEISADRDMLDAPDPSREEDAGTGKSRKASIKKSTRKTRGSSVASSAIASSTRGRTRSQSVISNPAADQAPQSTTTRGTRRGAKTSPPSTPAAEPEADTPQPRTTRTRRGTLQPSTSTTQPPPSSRRQPSPRPASTNTAARAQPRRRIPERRDIVHATRNFPRLSSVILNDVAAHRHAGPFQKPVSDRDVEGYEEIVKRPQDLKSIKAAITAGSRAVAAAVAARAAAAEESEGGAEDGAGAGVGTGATIVLPKTPDVVPPRGIVNSAQLEKEVMRMFANAVMFNTGDEGIVKDAREMSEDIAAKIQDWRGVEREGNEGSGGGADGGNSGGVVGVGEGEESEGGGGKRRRL